MTYQSEARNLLPSDTDYRPDVYVYDRFSEETVSVTEYPIVSGARPDVSGRGRRVTFFGIHETKDDSHGVYVYSFDTAKTEQVSVPVKDGM